MNNVRLLLLAIAQGIAVYPYFIFTSFVLDAYASTTFASTAIQVLPFLILFLLFLAYPATLWVKGKRKEAAIFTVTSIITALTVITVMRAAFTI